MIPVEPFTVPLKFSGVPVGATVPSSSVGIDELLQDEHSTIPPYFTAFVLPLSGVGSKEIPIGMVISTTSPLAHVRSMVA